VAASFFLPDDLFESPPPLAELTVGDITLQGNQVVAFRVGELVASEGGCAFITGKAGTGKSVVLRCLRSVLKVIVLAPTGLAALNVGGETIHSFFGIRPSANNIYRRKPRAEALAALDAADLIAIDEVSMVRADLLDAIDVMMRTALESDEPFGGKGVVCFGDPWQIEPVVKDEDKEWLDKGGYFSPMFFDSRVWKAANPSVIELDQIFRQKDPAFIAALNDIREGGTTGIELFNQCVREPDRDTLRLVFTNKLADNINAKRLSELDGDDWKSEANVFGEITPNEYPAATSLALKVGARVMVIKNIQDKGVVNGDMGTVEQLFPTSVRVKLDRDGDSIILGKTKWKKSRYEADGDGELIETEVASFKQFPLRLAWAVTVHKSQGQTYDRCHIEMETRPHANGQLYVGLSRCRTLEGLTIGRAIEPGDNRVAARVTLWQRGLRNPFGGTAWENI